MLRVPRTALVAAERTAAERRAACAAAHANDGDGATVAAAADGTASECSIAEESVASPVEVVAELVYASRFATGAGATAAAAAAQRPALRGGTPPVRLPSGDRYLAFLHSVHKRHGRSYYAVAPYTFEARPPFSITEIGRPFAPGGHDIPYPLGLVTTTAATSESDAGDEGEGAPGRGGGGGGGGGGRGGRGGGRGGGGGRW